MGHSSFDRLLEQWRDNKQSLSQQQRSDIATECSTNLLGDQSQTGLKALQHKYKVAAHAILAADSGLADQVARVRYTHPLLQHALMPSSPLHLFCTASAAPHKS